jgi:Uma2 family endonuclease
MQREIPIPHYSINDYNHWEGDWELINGYPYAMSPSPLPKHQFTSKQFVFALEGALRENKQTCNCSVYFETDWIINEETIVRPDIMIVCGHINPDDFVRIPPVLIVEIFSPATRLKDRNLKFNLYQQCGVKYYLMADPDAKTIEPFELVNNSYVEMKNGLQFALTKTCIITITSEQIFEP